MAEFNNFISILFGRTMQTLFFNSFEIDCEPFLNPLRDKYHSLVTLSFSISLNIFCEGDGR
jgi:hypothetical protein